MKAILEFNLPADQNEFDLVTNSSKMYTVLWNMDQWLRKQYKPNYQQHNEDSCLAYVKSSNQLQLLLTENNINLDS